MTKYFKLIAIITVSMLVLCACGGTTSDTQSQSKTAPRTYLHGTSGATGVHYAVGVAIANEINKTSDKIRITVQVTEGGSDNLRLVSRGETDFGTWNVDSLYNYRFAEGWVKPEEKVENVCGVMALQASYGQWLARKDANIKSLADLKGKRVSLGTTSITTHLMSRAQLAYYGIDADKDLASAVLLSQGEACDKLADGDLDAVFIVAGIPVAAYSNLLIEGKYDMIDIPPDDLQAILDQNFPSYEVGVIPAGTYPNIDRDIHASQGRNLIFCRDDLPEEDVYEFVKQVYENWDKIKMGHAALADLEWSNFPKTKVPLHPGAERFYKEKGLL